MKKHVEPRKKTGPKPPEAEEAERRAESGEPGDMKKLGESISGTQPEIGRKDTGAA